MLQDQAPQMALNICITTQATNSYLDARCLENTQWQSSKLLDNFEWNESSGPLVDSHKFKTYSTRAKVTTQNTPCSQWKLGLPHDHDFFHGTTPGAQWILLAEVSKITTGISTKVIAYWPNPCGPQKWSIEFFKSGFWSTAVEAYNGFSRENCWMPWFWTSL